jgi:hypothetical protein
MITIYASSESGNRLSFVAGHLLGRVLGATYCITSDAAFYRRQDGLRINYSAHDLGGGLWIRPQGLLSETGVRPVTDLPIAAWDGCWPAPFDPLAAAFYLLSLYEEYLPGHRTDIHGRFDHRDATLFRQGLLETPVVDRWAHALKAAWEADGLSTEELRLRQYQPVATYDVDFPYLYRCKGLFKNTAGLLRDLWRGRTQAVKDRLSVTLLRSEDPYFQALRLIHTAQVQAGAPYYLFVLLGKRGKYGRSTLYPTPGYYRYLRSLDHVTLGLHPSYQLPPASAAAHRRLFREKQQLEQLLQRPITATRRHFLQMQTPDTFRAMQAAGVCDDFTLAFAHAPGFRSGTAVPHPFYDLTRDETTSLLLHPTVMMDSSLIFHLKLTPEAALKKIYSLIDACRQSGGDYISLWHNSNLAGGPESNPWVRVFLDSLRYGEMG